MSERGSNMQMGEAIFWLICCSPVGMIKMGQGLKFLAWLVLSMITGGLASFVWIIDYLMCANKFAKGANLGEWEFFPRD